jgi:hypothetical protein
MGMGKSSGSSQAQLTPEQKQLLQAQTSALTGTFLPAYQSTIGLANNALNQVNPAAGQAAQTAMNVGQQTGALQQAGGTQAYQEGLGGSSQLAGYQTGLGQGLANQGGGGVNQLAGYQAGLGSNLTGQGASQLSQLFSPQFKQQQINAALQPATEDIREQMNQQGSLFGGAGALGSSRQALASQNLASLGQARLGNIAAQTSAGVEQQRQNAANTLLGAGQTATGQAGGLYSGLLGAGQTALGAGQAGYGNLANLGQQGLSAAQQSAAARIGYAQTPQDVLSKYASVIYGTPQASTTPNFAGTQGSNTSSKGFKI